MSMCCVSGDIESSLVNVRQEDPGGRFTYGTGFWVGDEVVYTVYHLVDRDDKIYVTKHGESKMHRAFILAFDPVADIALLKVPKQGGRPLHICETADGPTQYFHALRNTMFPERVSGSFKGIGEYYEFVFNSVIRHGFSGGPVTDRCGTCFYGAITSSNFKEDNPETYFSIPFFSENIMDALKKYAPKSVENIH